MLYRRMMESQFLKLSSPSFDTVSMYKIKTDLKETFMSPYSIPFNAELLKLIK